MMTRPNFKAIAEIIKQRELIGGMHEKRELRELASELARYFKQDNPTFDRSKFIRACGWYDE